LHLPPASLPATRNILLTGATGYLGCALIPALLARGHCLRALVRPGSERKLPAGVDVVTGSPLREADIARVLPGADTLVHLVGVPKPSPAKARAFREIDLVSIQAAAAAAARAPLPPHVVYLSVAQPAPVMKAYLAVRAEGEALLRAAQLDATCLRPWYVLGPGHRWPLVLLPLYAVLRQFPSTRATAERLGFVALEEMVAALVRAVEDRPSGVRTVEVPEIRTSVRRVGRR
jgi:uncharacterized protein YbjT (DUF2867 family)